MGAPGWDFRAARISGPVSSPMLDVSARPGQYSHSQGPWDELTREHALWERPLPHLVTRVSVGPGLHLRLDSAWQPSWPPGTRL